MCWSKASPTGNQWRQDNSSSIDGAGVDNGRHIKGEVDLILKMGGKLSAQSYVCRKKETWAHR